MRRRDEAVAASSIIEAAAAAPVLFLKPRQWHAGAVVIAGKAMRFNRKNRLECFFPIF
jgi:hypothetical protein